MSHQLERLLLHLETIRAGWLRGVPVRATELDGQLEELLRLIVGANPGHVFRAHTVVARLADLFPRGGIEVQVAEHRPSSMGAN